MLLIQTISDNMIKNLKDGVIKNWLEAALPSVLSFFWCVVLAFITYYVGKRIIDFIRKVFAKALTRHNVEIGVRQFFDGLLKVICYGVLILLILHLFGVETSSFAAAIASIGVTVGLALQGSLSNFAGGVLILILKPFKVGDYIIEDTHKNEGVVKEITIFYTKLLTIDNHTVILPNGILANASLTNCTAAEHRMINLVFSISYEDDIKEAKDIIERTARAIDGVEGGEMKVFVNELGSSSVDLGVRFYVATTDYWRIRWQLLEDVKYALEAGGMTIPFNQLDVHTK